MKTHSRGVTGRIVSFILVIVMIMSMLTVGLTPASAADVDLSGSAADLGTDSLSSVGASGVGGNSSLFTQLDSDDPYLIRETTNAYIDNDIIFTADGGAWLGLYPSTVTTPKNTTEAIYTFSLSGYEGEPFDIRQGVYNPSNSSGCPRELQKGSFTLYLFEKTGAYNVLAKNTFTVGNGNRTSTTVDGNALKLEMSRNSYLIGEPIYVYADVLDLDIYGDAWVGVYAHGADSATTAPEYIMYVGKNYGTNGTDRFHKKQTDIKSVSEVNNGMELMSERYDLRLFLTKNPADGYVLETDFYVRTGVMLTGKSDAKVNPTYGYGERIMTLGYLYDQSNVSVSNQLVAAGNANTSTIGFAYNTLMRVYMASTATTTFNTSSTFRYIVSGDKVTLLSTSGGGTYNRPNCYFSSTYSNIYFMPYFETVSGSDVKISGTLTAAGYLYKTASTSAAKVVSTKFPVGTAYNYLGYYNHQFAKVQIGGYVGYINVGYNTRSIYTVVGTLTNQYEGYLGTYVNHNFRVWNTGDLVTVDSNAHVDLFKDGTVDTSYSYKLSTVPNTTKMYEGLAPASYIAKVTNNSSTTSHRKTSGFTVSSAVTGEFASGAYEVDNLTDGFANGRVALRIDAENSYGYVDVGAFANVYWADENGKPLEGYAPFYRVPIDKALISFEMQPYSIIPEGAAGLVAYVEYNGVQGTTGYVIDLPEGCATYDGLDEGIISEFQVISDTKLGHGSATQYPNNDKHYKYALTDITNTSPESLGVFINGDVTAGGTLAQWELPESLRTEVATATGKAVPPIYVSHGNVDDNADGVGMSAYVDFVNSHGGEITEDKPYYSMMLNGYKFIVLCDDDGDNYITAKQIAWLDAELADNEENNEGKPVFILYHYALEGGALEPYSTDRNQNTEDFIPVLKKYNNVYMFSGNHRVDLASTNNTMGGTESLPVCINASSTSGTHYVVDGEVVPYGDTNYPNANEDSAQGLYVRIYEDKIVVLGRDFNEDESKWIPEACCVLYNDDVSSKELETDAYEIGDVIPVEDYFVNEKNRTVTFESSDKNILTVDEDGNITAVGEGTATVTAIVHATDTEVVAREKVTLRIFEHIDLNYYVKGSFDNWGEGVLLAATDDPDVLSGSVKLEAGNYQFRLNQFETWFGNSGSVSNKTISPLVMNEDAACTLKATGGTYTFTYSISTNTLKISCVLFEDNGGVSGDSTLIDLVDSGKGFVRTNKESYVLGEAIYVTADNGNWVGIYPEHITEYANTSSTYWYYVEGHECKPVDIRTLKLNNATAGYDPASYTGSYKAVLFATSNQSKVLDTVHFDVTDQNYQKSYNNTLSTNKTTYYYGEDILVSGWTDRPDLKPWVCIVDRGVTPSTEAQMYYWYYLPIVDGAVDSTSRNIIDISKINKGVALEPGEYDVHLYRTSNYNHLNCILPITVVDGKGTISADKDTYGRYEDISVTTTYPTYADTAWVGVYAESTLKGANPTGSSGLKAWYYIDPCVAWTVVLQDVVTDSDIGNTFTLSEAVPGDYSIFLFGDGGYKKIQAKDTFTIESDVTGSFGNGVYQVDKLYDGFANGRVILEVSEDSLGYVGLADAVLYWADANGKPLKGYTSLHKSFVDKTVISIDMNSHTIIPEGAESLVAYMSVKGKMSPTGYKIDLPEDCFTYTGLDEGIVSEFQIISDTHIVADSVTTYPDGNTKYHSNNQNNSNEYFQKMLTDIANNSASSTGIFVAGDISNNGLSEEFAVANSLYNSVASSTGKTLPPMYVTMGNHDTFVGSSDAYVAFANGHGAGITTDTPYYSKMVNGYKYIFLAGDNSAYYGRYTATINSGDAELSNAQLQWLDAELLDNEQNNAGKPVFILLHQPMANTVAGSLTGQDWDGVANEAELKAVLNKYNNVVLIGGHSHWLIDSPQNMFAGSKVLPVAVNAGSTSYLWTDYENVSSSSVDGSQGFYVRAYEDKVVFLGRDFVNNLWVPGACFVLYNEDVQAESLELIVEDVVPAKDYVSNLYGRTLTYTSSDPDVATVSADGTITAVGRGTATITVYAAPTNTEVITREKITVKVDPYMGDVSDYYIKGSFDNWGDGYNMTYTRDVDVVTTSIELAQGVYEFKVNCGNILYGNTGTIVDTTDTTSDVGWVMNPSEASNCKLQATGGTYTFKYKISTNSLFVTYKPASTEETGANTATIYVDYTNSDFTETPYIYIWEPERDAVNKNIGPLWPGMKLEGPNAEGYYYRTFKFDTSYQFVINNGTDAVKTADSAVHTESEVYVTFTGGTEYKEGKAPKFWIDLNPNDDTSNIDLLYPEMGSDGIYYFYLPAGINTRTIEFNKTEGTTLKISYIEIKEGSTMNVSGGVNKTRNYILGGDYSGKFRVKQSASTASLYTYSNKPVPTATGYGENSTAYSSDSSIMMMNSDMTLRLPTTQLESFTGSDFLWDNANDYYGRYSIDLSMFNDAELISGSAAATDYKLISLASDEARMRAMLTYELAESLGLDYVADYEIVDFYNDYHYIGTYMLVKDIAEEDSLNAIDPYTTTNAAWIAAKNILKDTTSTYKQLSQVIDVESFAKVYLLLELTKDENGGENSFFVYEKDGKFFADVVWDYEYTFGLLTQRTASVAGRFAENAKNALNDPEGWWVNSRTMSSETDTLTILATLCQNEEFWNVVKAEWNEVILNTALTYSDSTVTSASALDLKFLELYNLVKDTTAMDEFKSGLIAKDPASSAGVADTGDTFNDAAVWFNNFYYNRLMWMNSQLESSDYEFATPTLKTDKESYGTDETIKLIATCKSSGNLVYNFYDADGNLKKSITSDTGYVEYDFTTTEEIDELYKVVVTSENTTSDSAVAYAHVIVEKFNFELDVTYPEVVPAGMVATITATTNVDKDVLYYLYDETGTIIDANRSGVFDIITSPDEAEITLEYTVEASTNINGAVYKASKDVAIDVVKFEFDVTLKAPESVEAGMDIQLNASSHSPSLVTYTFYNAEDDTVIAENNLGTCLVETLTAQKGSVVSFYVIAQTEAFGISYSVKSDVVSVELTEITDVYNLTVYFKSTSTLGYNPMITTQGAVDDFTDDYMIKDMFICKNESETASYYWYKVELSVSKNNPSVYFRIHSARYAMEVQGNLIVTEDKTYYFAVDNLNSGTQLVDLTDASPDERNWCESALHMVYDPRFDGEESLANISARVDLRLVGDTDASGKVNIRDATLIQKFLADIVTMNETSIEVADMDNDEKVTIKDATALQKKLAGISYNSYADIGGNTNETH